MSYDLNRLQAEVNEVLANANVRLRVPVKLNPRTYQTLGTAYWYRYLSGKVAEAYIEFSKVLVENATDESIRDVVLHECAHIICAYRYTEEHGHDRYFKQICHEIGTTADKTKMPVKYNTMPVYKYELICPTCGVISHMNRKTNAIKYINQTYCTRCGKTTLGKLTVKANW